jgi:hypothetical protein
MSTRDQTLSVALRGEALLAAKRPELPPLIDHLRGVAQGRDDLRTECAGIIAGSLWIIRCHIKLEASRTVDGLLRLGLERSGRWLMTPKHKTQNREPQMTQGFAK